MVSALDSEASGPGSDPRKIVLCSWARHFTLTVPHSTQVYKWVPRNRDKLRPDWQIGHNWLVCRLYLPYY